MKQIPLTKGQVALVDDADYLWLSGYRWCFSSDGYAVNYYWDETGTKRKRSMHRLLMAEILEHRVPRDLQVDHINHQRIDNRRENLRLATRSQNQAYKGLQVNNTSGYKGVVPNRRKYEVRIRYQGKRFYLGLYTDPVKAALVYDGAARLLYADFAGVNFPDRPTPPEIEQLVIQRLKKKGIVLPRAVIGLSA
ncbi:MAG: hypothetical protein CL610_19955 [Anaerolineaceae bacterium]|nr:hypothetical protein [Anaerolineaceae bacterium]